MTSITGNPFQDVVRKGSSAFMWLGAALLVIGIAALVFPFTSTTVITVVAGWTFIFTGLATFFGSFSIRGAGPFFAALLYSLLSIGTGVFILARPDAGQLALTLAFGVMFMIQGAFEMVLAFELRPVRSWWVMLLSALASIILSVAVLSGLPGTSRYALGIILGVDFASSGIAFLMLGGAARRELGA